MSITSKAPSCFQSLIVNWLTPQVFSNGFFQKSPTSLHSRAKPGHRVSASLSKGFCGKAILCGSGIDMIILSPSPSAFAKMPLTGLRGLHCVLVALWLHECFLSALTRSGHIWELCLIAAGVVNYEVHFQRAIQMALWGTEATTTPRRNK